MLPIVQRRRILSAPAKPVVAKNGRVRSFESAADIEVWLELRHRAFARQRLGVGRWDQSDFEREFLQKPWWRPEWMWFAEHSVTDFDQRYQPEAVDADGLANANLQVVGTVCLALRGTGDRLQPVVHWLCVLPTARRQGIARALMIHLEAAAWQAGHREIWLETHVEWQEAALFYDSLGYLPVAWPTERSQQEQQQQ